MPNILRKQTTMLALIAIATIASAAPTLTVTNGAVYTATSTQAVVTALTPSLVAPPLPTDGTNPYVQAFNSWNASGGGQGWTLVQGAGLNNTTTFNVNLYKAFVSGLTGGVEININYTPGAGAPPAASNPYNSTMALWTQDVATNAKLAGSLPGNPYLDNPADAQNNGGSVFPAPEYPYQYVGSSFYDKPRRTVSPTGPVINWTAEAYISSFNQTTKTITVFDGVKWGFSIAPIPPPPPAPEPSAYLSFAVGGAGLFLLKRKKAKSQ